MAAGEGRAIEAAQMAINSPLLETSIEGASGVIFNVTGGPDMTLHEVNEAADVIYSHVDKDANIIFGSVIDERLQGELQITVIATGFQLKNQQAAAASRFGVQTPFDAGYRYAPAALGAANAGMPTPVMPERSGPERVGGYSVPQQQPVYAGYGSQQPQQPLAGGPADPRFAAMPAAAQQRKPAPAAEPERKSSLADAARSLLDLPGFLQGK
jgi:cell division protein FtsZ